MKKDILELNNLWNEYLSEQLKYGPDRLRYMITFSEHTKYFFTHLKIVDFYIGSPNNLHIYDNIELFNFRFEYMRFQHYHLTFNEGIKDSILPKDITEDEQLVVFEFFQNFVSSLLIETNQYKQTMA